MHTQAKSRIPPGLHEFMMHHSAFPSSLLRLDLSFVLRDVTVFGSKLAEDPDIVANPADKTYREIVDAGFPWNLALPPREVIVVALHTSDGRVIVRAKPGWKFTDIAT